MKSILNQSRVLGVLLTSLPLMYGCNDGGSSAGGSSLGGISETALAPSELLFAIAPEDNLQFAKEGKAFDADISLEKGGEIPISHNPEPITLLLFGLGATAMAGMKLANKKHELHNIHSK